MQLIPGDILTHYEAILKKRAVPVSRHADYRKWLRYYLDFRSKYSLPDSRSEQARMFIQKLREKKQTPEQQKQAAHALSLFFESQPRVKNFNFDAGILTVHGKGSKDRTVPILQTIMPELTAQFEAIKKLHDEDLAAGYAGVFLEDQLEKNTPQPARISSGNGFSRSNR